MPEIIFKGPFHGVHFLMQGNKQYQKATILTMKLISRGYETNNRI